jgi:hypothetical protein
MNLPIGRVEIERSDHWSCLDFGGTRLNRKFPHRVPFGRDRALRLRLLSRSAPMILAQRTKVPLDQAARAVRQTEPRKGAYSCTVPSRARGCPRVWKPSLTQPYDAAV